MRSSRLVYGVWINLSSSSIPALEGTASNRATVYCRYHGGMPYGAGYVAATQAQAAEIIDPRSVAVNEIAALYAQYPHIGPVLPAVGYHAAQLSA